MARVLGLEEVDTALRSAVSSALRLCDEAIVLPSASRSDESGAFKNVVFKLRGDEENLSPSLFECQLFTGLSAVAVDEADAKRILADRRGAADKLAAIDTSTKRGEMSLESNKIDLMQQQLDFEKTDLFKGVSETIAGLEEKGLVYSTDMGYVATRAVKVKKVKK